jgi:uncharacterized membrane protein (UPF0127 family)
MEGAALTTARVAGGLLMIAIVAAAFGHAAAADVVRPDGQVEFVRPDGTPVASLVVEIADAPDTRARGLMGRVLPDDRSGMLFVFDTAEVQTFWMRNTPGSLDMIFVAPDGTVLNVAAATTPMSDRNYASSGPSLYVVEARAGFAERHGLRRGDGMRWRRSK